MKQLIATLIIICFFLALPLNGQAQETSGSFADGSVKIGDDNRACSGALEGAVRYNTTTDVIEYCDGTSWYLPSVNACTPPSGCTNIGDVCADGSQFAGFLLYSGDQCEALFVTDDNQSASIQWKTSTGTNDITPDDFIDGKENTANKGGGTFPAFDLCDSLSRHSKTDWYLPARRELDLLAHNQTAIDANASGSFTGSGYWTSTEDASDGSNVKAMAHTFSNNDRYDIDKNFGFDVRCVRRD